MSFNPQVFYENGRMHLLKNGLQLYVDAGNYASYIGSGTTINDISGNARNGTLVNGVGYSSSNGGSLVFDGSNDYVGSTGIDNASRALNGASAITFGAWVKRANTGNTQAFIGFSNTASNHKILIAFNASNYVFAGVRSANESAQVKTTSTAFASTSAWYYIVATANLAANTINIYVNGILQSATGTISFAQSTIANGTTATYNRIGSELLGGIGTNFNGNIAQVQLYNRELTATEIALNFNAFKNKFGL